jgi:hypothetical protein
MIPGSRTNLRASAIRLSRDSARREGFEPPTARSVDWCSASVWSAPDGSGLLTLGASSVQTAPEGSCRIVWMIKRMIKPCDAAPSVTQTTAGIVERSPDIPSGDAWRTGAGLPWPQVASSGLQDSSGSSTACWQVLSSLLRSGASSSQYAPVRFSSACWNVHRNDRAGVKPVTRCLPRC